MSAICSLPSIRDRLACCLTDSEETMKTIAGITLLTLSVGILWAADTASTAPAWVKIDEGKTGARDGSMLVHVPDLKQLLLVGPGKGPFVESFDPATKAWSEFAAAAPI